MEYTFDGPAHQHNETVVVKNAVGPDFKCADALTEADPAEINNERDDIDSITDFSRDFDNPVTFVDDPAFRITA